MDSNVNSYSGQSAGHSGRQSQRQWFRSHFNPRPPDDDEPQDWWFASTAIPLIAAATAPLANVMSIVALVMPWRSNIIHGKVDSFGDVVQTGFRDPRWAIALNSSSLAFGVTGNFFLLCNFTRVIRYTIAISMSITTWSISTILLVAATVTMNVYASPVPPGQIYSQAYWSAVISAALHFILTFLLMINMLGYVLGHYPQYAARTDGQRTLILQTLSFVIWLLVGAAIFHVLMDISFADALYFSDLTILTLGYGHIVPLSAVSRGIVFPYAVMGIVILGLVIGSIHQFSKEVQYENVIRKHFERKRQTIVRHASTRSHSHGSAAQDGSYASGLEGPVEIEYRRRPSDRRLMKTSIGSWAKGRPKLVVLRKEKDRFNAMRAIQHKTNVFRRTYNLIMSLIMFGIVWSCGALVFWRLEESWTYFDSLYFGFCSLLTIGYGDYAPSTNAARPFFVVWSLIAIPTMTILISGLSDTLVAWFKRATDIVADWTVLPQAANYRGLFRRLHMSSAARGEGEENRREGFTDRDMESGRSRQSKDNDSSHRPRSLEELAEVPSPMELAQQLALAIQRTTKDALQSHPKHYSYEEWVEIIRLIRFTTSDPHGVVLHEDEFGVLDWDWIGETSPMLSIESEPEWVLDRLCESLIRWVNSQGQKRFSGQDQETTVAEHKDEVPG